MTDITFIFFVMGSLYFLVLSEEGEDIKHYAALSGLFFGLAFMTKQLEALLIPLIIFVYFAATGRGLRLFFTKRFALFWQIGILVVSPWLIYMVLRFGPDFWNSYFVFQGTTRAISFIEGHSENHLYYFSYLAHRENLVWIIMLPFSVVLCVFKAVARRSKKDTLILVWMSIVLLFFTVAQTKLFWYILPAYPAFALAVAAFLFGIYRTVRISILDFRSKIAERKGNENQMPASQLAFLSNNIFCCCFFRFLYT